jgi:hypothetical protein
MRSFLLAAALCLMPPASQAEEPPPLVPLAGKTSHPQVPYFRYVGDEPNQGDCPDGQSEVWVNAHDQGSIWSVDLFDIWQKPGAEPLVYGTGSAGTGIQARVAYREDTDDEFWYFFVKQWDGERLLIWNDHVFHSACRPSAILKLLVPGIHTDLPPHAHLHLTVERAKKSCAALPVDTELYVFKEGVLYQQCGRAILYWMDRHGIDTTWGRPVLDLTRCAARTILAHPDPKASVYSVLEAKFSASCSG